MGKERRQAIFFHDCNGTSLKYLSYFILLYWEVRYIHLDVFLLLPKQFFTEKSNFVKSFDVTKASFAVIKASFPFRKPSWRNKKKFVLDFQKTWKCSFWPAGIRHHRALFSFELFLPHHSLIIQDGLSVFTEMRVANPVSNRPRNVKALAA